MSSTDFDVVQLGTAEVDEETGLPVVQAVNPAGDDEEDVEHYGKVDLSCTLGVTALPAPKDKDGAAEGIILRSCGGSDGTCVGGRDDRVTRDIVGELSGGDTCLHATGKGFASRVMCKEQMVAIAIGDPADVLLMLDRQAKQINIAGFGHMFEMSDAQGIVLCDATGQGVIQIKDGHVTISGISVTLGNPTTAVPAIVGVAPVAAPVPSLSVKIGV